MDGYYGQQYGQGFQGQAAQGMSPTDMYGNQQYNPEYEEMSKSRRQSYHLQPNTPTTAHSMDMDRNGVAGFSGSAGGGQLENFQFDPSAHGQSMMMGSGNMFPTSMGAQMHQQRPTNLNLMTQYNNANDPYFAVASPMNMYHTPTDPNGDMAMNLQNQMMRQSVAMGMDGSEQNYAGDLNSATSPDANMGQDSLDASMMGNTGNRMMTSSAPGSAFDNGNSGSMFDTAQSSPMHASQNAMDGRTGSSVDSMQVQDHQGSRRQSMSLQHRNMSMQQNSPYPSADGGNDHKSYSMQVPADEISSWDRPPQPARDVAGTRPGPQPNIDLRHAYSASGFDMLTVLMHVATRKNPSINIGAVDLSCAFVVCDVFQHDIPIVYCSENFERLTGYTKHEILGRNCRFLQGPDGKVQAGVKRSYVDDDSVLYLKNMITARKEAQVSLINYRKGGQPFMNLLTMIPIPYDTPDEIRYYVGFQVDLVEQPNSVTNKNPDGTYTINYQRGLTMPRYVYSTSDGNPTSLEAGQTVTRDDVSTVLSTIGSGDSELSKRLWDKVLLENTDDVVLVLSLKGLFLYLSPSSKKVLEYEASELTGTALSSVCHPSDIVPVTRELKDTSSSAVINVVFRIRRKVNGFMWFEGHGALHTEQGKGRKSIVLVGRERPVYTLSKSLIAAAGGIGDNEVWTKLSTSGMFLFVSSNIRSLLDRQPEELVGTSMQSLMRQETRVDFMRAIELCRGGKRGSAKHELINKRGQVLQAFSTLYPGDATEGEKPTFFIAQTRLIKYSRPNGASRPAGLSKLERQSSSTSMPAGSTQPNPGLSRQNSMSSALPSPQRFMSTFEAATTYAGQHGLELGNQDVALASEENLFDELKTTRSTSWQFELRQMAKRNRFLAEELQGLLAARKKRKRRKGAGQLEKDCANCHTRVTPEWRRGPSGNRDLCNSCGLRWAKQQGRISPRTNTQRSQHSGGSDKASNSPVGSKLSGERSEKQGSIDGTLAETHTAIQGGNQELQGADGPHLAKAVKMESQSTSPDRRGSSGVPAKIEEREDEDAMDD